MKRHTLNIALTLLLGGGLLLSCSSEKLDIPTENARKIQQAKITNDSLEQVYQRTLKEIDDNLAQIKLRQDIVDIRKDSDAEFQTSSKQRIIENIKVINSLMDQNKAKIDDLQAALRNSKNKNIEWQEKVEALRMLVDERNAEVDQLKDQLAQSQFLYTELDGKYTALELDNQLLNDSLKSTRDEMNAAYFAIGSYKELKNKGILEKEGGFIGIGRNKVLTDTFDNNYFSKVDIRDVKRIPLFSKKAEIVTDHPADSYELTESKDEKMVAYLEIKKPDDFWKASRYMVVEVKK